MTGCSHSKLFRRAIEFPHPPAPRDDAHPLVLALLQAVHLATAERQAPYYVGVETLGLPFDPERNGAAIVLAVYRGWLTVSGDPLQSVAITVAGLALLKEKSMV
jgi:hypothetical protein